MRKIYNKPEMFYEEYELSTAIAGNCSMADGQPLPIDDGAINYNSGDVCTYNVMGLELFSSGNCADADQVGDMFCYQQPDGSTGVFNS